MGSLKHPHGPFQRPLITRISKDDWADIEFPDTNLFVLAWGSLQEYESPVI